MTAYYNEFDPHAAAWLRELIKAGEIAPGDVDERSITDVDPTELAGYTQLHFFAGIGGWSRALRLAGIGDDVRIVTGSCPCQPFSSAGKGDGFDDPRHLWPHFFRIISHLRPARVVGEQVANDKALIWWDAVCNDLEGSNYTWWAADLCSAGIGAPHIRQRLYWVADTESAGGREDAGAIRGGQASRVRDEERKDERRSGQQERRSVDIGAARGLADAECHGDRSQAEPADHHRPQADRSTDQRGGCGGSFGGLADPHQVGRKPLSSAGQPGEERDAEPRGGIVPGWPSPLDGIRRDADWLHCRDGKWRPVKPGLVPLVDGLPRGVVPSSRVGMAFDPDRTAEARAMRLKGYGNAIDPELAAMFLRAVAL